MSNSASSSLVISKSPNQLAASISRDVSSCRQEEEQSVVSILPFEEASHKSIKIIVPEKKKNNGKDSAYDSPEIFRRRVEATILTCRKLGKTSLWIEVPMSHASVIEGLVSIPGLKFHHAEGNIAKLCLWMKDTECKIPSYGTHQVGVGGLLINSRNEVLCVRELEKNYFRWKIPGGLAELGEDLSEAVEREVLEETGISAKFKSMLTFRHTHGLQFNRSDMFFVCELEMKEAVDERTGEKIIPEPVPEEGEISAAAWVPLKEYMEVITEGTGHPYMQKVMKFLEEKRNIERTMLRSIVPGRKSSAIYYASE